MAQGPRGRTALERSGQGSKACKFYIACLVVPAKPLLNLYILSLSLESKRKRDINNKTDLFKAEE